MTIDEFLRDYFATAQNQCAIKAMASDDTIYIFTGLEYTYGEAMTVVLDLYFSGLIENYVIWCGFGNLI